MILRHLADAIRGQNWFTVLIELAVVVVGIFLGLQVDDWNERRKEASLESGYVERLEAEIDANIAVYQAAIEQSATADKLYRDYFDYLTDPAAPLPDKSELLGGLCRVGLNPGAPFDNSVHDELETTGRSELIGYVQLTHSLISYRTVQERWAEGTAQVVPVTRKTFSEIEKFISWQPVLEGGTYSNCLFDFEKFKTNDKAASLIAQAQRIEHYYLLSYKDILSKLMEVRTTLSLGYPQIVAAGQ